MNESAFDPEFVPIRPAATVIVVRDRPGAIGRTLEVLLVRRNTNLAFHGGSWVFPGGRIDDHEMEAADGDEAVAARRAAVREVHEETGLTVVEKSLVAFSHWTTPQGRNRRFSTSFFVVAGRDDAVAIDDGEIKDYDWLTPTDAVERSEAEEIQLAGPTYVSLLRIRACPSAAAAVDLARSEPSPVFRPRLYSATDGLTASVYEGDAAYESGDLHAPGPQHRMIMKGSSYQYVVTS
jgi:8-oxo-dGTP pyrophosphatase MutT (NUDIX family)